MGYDEITVWNTNGEFVKVIGGIGSGPQQFANPWSLTIDANGRLLVSDTGNHRIQVFDLNKEPVTVAQTQGEKNGF